MTRSIMTALGLILLLAIPSVRAAATPGEANRGGSRVQGTPPAINVWYGDNQRFGAVGTPQRLANILGSVSHPSGIASLWYSLNGGALKPLSFISDSRRLTRDGDFNIDLKFDQLLPGTNSVFIRALANSGDNADTTLTLNNLSNQFWPLPYTFGWSQLTDSAQVVDGKWALDADGISVVEPGYDRLIAIGDTTWNSYEVTVPITVHGQDADSTGAAYDDINGGPAVGVIMRWKGHTSTPTFNPPVTQPLTGYLPFGSIICYHFRNGGSNPQANQWETVLADGTNLTVPATSPSPALAYGIAYFFKVQVQTLPGTGFRYRTRIWPSGSDEPTSWLMTATAPTSALSNGSFLLMAHHVYATFGAVKVVPLNDGVPPAITNIAASPTAMTATITWTTDEPANSGVEYGLTGAYGSAVSDQTTFVKSHSIELTGLNPSTTYHYAVVSTDWGNASSTSSDLTFQTSVLTPPPTPVLIYPANTGSNIPTTFTLRWNRALNASRYHLQLGTDQSFGSGITVDDTSLADTLKTLSNLLPGTYYYWRVSARNNAGESPFSSVFSFVTALDAPALVSPANGGPNSLPSPRLTWRKIASATSYRVWVGTDSTLGSAAVLDDSLIVDTARVVTGLQIGQKYYWRVRAKNSIIIGAFSSAWAFTPGVAPPTLVSPVNGSSNQLVNPVLQWSPAPQAVSYDLQLGTDSTFASGLVVSDSLLADTSHAATGLVSGTTYYWRVRSRHATGPGQYSAAWSFSTGLSTVQLLSPPNGSVEQPLTISFVWRKVDKATAYAFQLATDSTFASGLIKNDASLTDTTRLVAGFTYKNILYWHVRPKQGLVLGPWSATWKTTTIIKLPEVVSLISPANGAMIPPDSARLIWTRSQPNVIHYWVEVAIDSNFNFSRIDSTVTDTTTVTHNLTNGSTYFWRIRAGSVDGWSPFSETRRFTIGTLGIAENEKGIPATFALDQNYPNPFNPSTWIHFALPKQTRVTLDIFNILGEHVATLLDEEMQAGYHRLQFSGFDNHGRQLSAGIYLYRMRTAEFTQSKKMILLK